MVVAHTGFWTYVLIAVIAFIIIAAVAPDVADSILESINDLSNAVRGE